MRKEKGITLIALIITIIVMLILVAVTISVALNGGIFNNATDAKVKTQQQADKEELLSLIASSVGTKGNLQINTTNLSKDGWVAEATENDKYLKCTSPRNNVLYINTDTGKIFDQLPNIATGDEELGENEEPGNSSEEEETPTGIDGSYSVFGTSGDFTIEVTDEGTFTLSSVAASFSDTGTYVDNENGTATFTFSSNVDNFVAAVNYYYVGNTKVLVSNDLYGLGAGGVFITSTENLSFVDDNPTVLYNNNGSAPSIEFQYKNGESHIYKVSTSANTPNNGESENKYILIDSLDSENKPIKILCTKSGNIDNYFDEDGVLHFYNHGDEYNLTIANNS